MNTSIQTYDFRALSYITRNYQFHYDKLPFSLRETLG